MAVPPCPYLEVLPGDPLYESIAREIRSEYESQVYPSLQLALRYDAVKLGLPIKVLNSLITSEGVVSYEIVPYGFAEVLHAWFKVAQAEET